MCMFSGEIQEVKGTNIFARLSGRETQYLVYSMSLVADQELAMILPLPVAMTSHKSLIRFISLENYPEFFSNIIQVFDTGDDMRSADMVRSRSILEVHQVGSYEASFVPSLADFMRLDPRFQLPESIWNSLPQYSDYGFAVFHLRVNKEGKSEPFHPMAFEFATRSPDRLFFPTIHVHDGMIHNRAYFDHYLLYQSDFDPVEQIESVLLMDAMNGDRSSIDYTRFTYLPAKKFFHIEKTLGIVDGSQPCRAIRIHGEFPNEDIVLAA